MSAAKDGRSPSGRATHEPSPKGLGHSVSVPNAALRFYLWDSGPWEVVPVYDGRLCLQSDDFTHDVRLYVDGDFAPGGRESYAATLAALLNAIAMEARQGGDAKQGSIEDDSAAIAQPHSESNQ